MNPMASKSSLLNEPPKDCLGYFKDFLTREGVGNIEALTVIAESTIKYLSGNTQHRHALIEGEVLMKRWYDSLAMGEPDYSVYEEDYYLAELWACWIMYSRKYLLHMEKPNSLSPHGVVGSIQPKVVADLGCGFGYTTAALKQLYPDATVYGTNIEGTVQYRVAKSMSLTHNFQLMPVVQDIPVQVDVAFASEYFEHFQKPVEHLEEIIAAIKPRAWWIASTFGQDAIGHFTLYEINGKLVDGKTTSRMFNNTLRNHGYRSVKTRLWNNRPTYWVLGRELNG